jgi:HD superfamily phosphodiesterase
MEIDKISTIHRVFGDAQDITSRLDSILSMLRNPAGSEEEIFYHLRRVVDKCDYIASEIEKVFALEIPAE